MRNGEKRREVDIEKLKKTLLKILVIPILEDDSIYRDQLTMKTSSSLPLLFIAFLCNAIAASAFVGCRSTSGSRIFLENLHVEEICRMSSTPDESNIPDNLMEQVWRYVKKPLISVGGKGATNKHGNSLRQLLDDHTVVKVKVNTKSFGKSIRAIHVPLMHRVRKKRSKSFSDR